MSQMKKVVARAPGRVCLFGEHQDYLNLPVIAAAINRYIEMSATPNGSGKFRIDMPDVSQKLEIDLSDDFSNLQKRDYFGSAFRVMRRKQMAPDRGYDVTIRGNIPINAGASSSSAMVVAFIVLLHQLAHPRQTLKSSTLAKLAFQIEVLEHNEPGGMMDQYTISLGNVVHIDTEHSTFTTLTDTLDGLVLANSGIKKDTLSTLATLRAAVFESVKILESNIPGFQLKTAGEADLQTHLKLLPAHCRDAYRAAVRNHLITQKALSAFAHANLDLAHLGDLMYHHHCILRDFLGISPPKIEQMIDAAMAAGASGAKINGSGGGGTIVILAPGRQEAVVEALQTLGVEAFAVKVSRGAEIIN